MILCIDDVLTPAELDQIQAKLADAEFVDGKLTAGRYAKSVKHNTQLKGETTTAEAVRAIVNQALQRNALFQTAIRPCAVRPFLFSRYSAGMHYDWHIDNALMGEPSMRTDVSLTLFLNEPSTYEGGELIVDTSLGMQSFKLNAGSMVVYLASTLHRVAPVTKGVRSVAITWVQSLIRDAHQREILFDLDTARQLLFEKHGKTPEFDLICKTHANLLRQWVNL